VVAGCDTPERRLDCRQLTEAYGWGGPFPGAVYSSAVTSEGGARAQHRLQGRREFAATSAAASCKYAARVHQLPVCSERLIHEGRSCVDGAGKSTFLREAGVDLTTP